jgi:hypothetical protein
MSKGKSRARRYLTLMAAAGTVAICAVAVHAVPAGAQTVSVSRTAAGATEGSAKAAAPVAARHIKPGQLGKPASSDDNTLYEICLTNADTHCLAWGSGSSVVLKSSGPMIEWKVVTNGANEQTYEALGVTSGTTDNDGLCLAAAAYASGANNRVYATSNCWSNAFASWAPALGVDDTIYYNVNSLNQGNPYDALTALNTREGAFLYVEPQESGTWQTWSQYAVGSL